MTPDYVSLEDFSIPCLLVNEKVYLIGAVDIAPASFNRVTDKSVIERLDI